MPEEYALLDWLDRRLLINRAKRALRRPVTWFLGATYGLMAGFTIELSLAGLQPGPGPKPPIASAMPLLEALAVVVGIWTIFLSVSLGMAMVSDREEYVLLVVGSPISPLTILRRRLARSWVGVVLASGLSAVLMGAAFAGVYAFSVPGFVARASLVGVPLVMVCALAGVLLASYRVSHPGSQIDTALAVLALAAVAAFAIGLLNGGSGVAVLTNDPIAAALLTAVGPIAGFVAGTSSLLAGLLVVVGAWVGATLLTALVARMPYPTPMGFRSPSTPPMTLLTPEVPVADDRLRRLREWFRPRYRDAGVGADAVRGEAWTLVLRSGDLLMAGFLVAMIAFFGLLTDFGGPSRFPQEVPPMLLALGLPFGIMAMLPFSGAKSRPAFADQLRQLPIPSVPVAVAAIAPRWPVAAVLGSVVGIGAGIGVGDGVTGFLTGGLLVSLLLLYLVFEAMMAPSLESAQEGAPMPGSSQLLPAIGLLAAVVLPETILAFAAPSPLLGQVLEWPYAVALTANVLLVWALFPRAAQRLTAPARG